MNSITQGKSGKTHYFACIDCGKPKTRNGRYSPRCNKCNQAKNAEPKRPFDGKKHCPNCGEIKSLFEFSLNRSNPSGYQTQCKSCAKDRNKIYRATHKEVRKEFRERKKIQISETVKKYYKKNIEKIKQYYKSYYSQNRNKLLEYQQKYSKENREILRARENNYRAKKKANGGTLSWQEWESVLEYYGNKCLRCETQDRITIDHVIPISKGGKNSIENVQPLCRSCNSSKNDKEIDFRFDKGKRWTTKR